MELPIYKIILDPNDDLGLQTMSLVQNPAMEELWVAMNAQEIKLAKNDDKQIITGPALIPNKKIYRFMDNVEFYIYFDEQTIFNTIKKWFKTGLNKNFNLEHDGDDKIEGVVVESWIVSGENDKSKQYGFNLPDGTWMLSTYIEDKNLWEKYIKTNKVRGYSIEGMFDLTKVELKKAKEYITKADIDNLYNKVDSKTFITKKELDELMNLIDSNEFMMEDEYVTKAFTEYNNTVNMSYSQLEAWGNTKCSKEASVNRSPIDRNLRLLSTKKEDWTLRDARDANRTIAFVARMKNTNQGNPIGECGSKRDISLKNWGFDPKK